jgi:hypothetical protein
MIDQRPSVIAKCADVADVIVSLQFACENGVRIPIIDLSPVRYVHVDPPREPVRAGGGSLWGHVDHATHAFATSSTFLRESEHSPAAAIGGSATGNRR